MARPVFRFFADKTKKQGEKIRFRYCAKSAIKEKPADPCGALPTTPPLKILA
jgi:hypothetical protein